jgi:hypothetical protein
MLAGRMKLKTFVALAVLAAVGSGVLLYMLFNKKDDATPPRPQDVVVTTPTSPPPRPEPRPEPGPEQPRPTHPAELAARPHDAEVIAWSKKSISGDKVKDASKGKPYKINLYKDAGHATVNRAKVDLDRDDKFDEKYTFDGDTITLQIAPADDESYTKTFHWTGSAWLPEGAAPTAEAPPASASTTANANANANANAEAAPSQPPSTPRAKIDLPARAYDAEVMAWSTRSIDGDKVKDASKGKPYKINLYKDAGHATVNRAKVDSNRNDKFEDKYTFEPGKITLQRAPADDEQYSETYHWTGAGWAKQP